MKVSPVSSTLWKKMTSDTILTVPISNKKCGEKLLLPMNEEGERGRESVIEIAEKVRFITAMRRMEDSIQSDSRRGRNGDGNGEAERLSLLSFFYGH